jgi:hypothetical protein
MFRRQIEGRPHVFRARLRGIAFEAAAGFIVRIGSSSPATRAGKRGDSCRGCRVCQEKGKTRMFRGSQGVGTVATVTGCGYMRSIVGEVSRTMVNLPRLTPAISPRQPHRAQQFLRRIR